MNDYLKWRNWAGALDDAAFSRLWMALGSVAALHPEQGELTDWLGKLWSATLRSRELSWVMPEFDAPIAQRLQAVQAQEWVAKWNSRIGKRLDRVPIRIGGWPPGESTSEWLAALYTRVPVASLRLPLVSNNMLGWPVRMAALTEVDKAVLNDAAGLWPTSGLARMVGSNAECFACDLLLLSGEFDDLSSRLGHGEVVANFLVAGVPGRLSRDDHDRFLALVEATQAGGFALFEQAPGFDLPGRVNHLVEQLSHARRVDVAACLAFLGTPGATVVGLCDELARFTIRQVAERLQTRSRNLQRAVRLPTPLRAELDAIMPRVPQTPAPGAPMPSGLESMGSDTVDTSGGLESLGGDAGADETASARAVPEVGDRHPGLRTPRSALRP